MVQFAPPEYSGSSSQRFGQNLGAALAEQIPKSMDQYILREGLNKFAKESKNLTPLEKLARLSSIPGVTPQMVQSFGELAAQEGQATALKGLGEKTKEPPKNPFPVREPTKPKAGIETPKLTTAAGVAATVNPYQPLSYHDKLVRAGELLEANPELYKNDSDRAMLAVENEERAKEAQNLSLQNQRKLRLGVQDLVQNGLREQQKNLGAVVPGDVYTNIETKAINSVLPEEEGGEGLTEIQARNKYGAELQSIAKDYEAIRTVGSWKLLTASPSGNKQELRSIRNKFKERNDLENFADKLQVENGLSPSKSYYMAYPISETKSINNEIVKLPTIRGQWKKTSAGFPYYKEGMPEAQRQLKTHQVAEKIAPMLKNTEASPLAIAEELNARGYDPRVFLNYVDKHRKELNLNERQGRELDKQRTFMPTNDDVWMFYLSGLDELVEQ